jgi:hypothetical protein
VSREIKVTETGCEVERSDATLERARRCEASRAEAETLFGLHLLRPATIHSVARYYIPDMTMILNDRSILYRNLLTRLGCTNNGSGPSSLALEISPDPSKSALSVVRPCSQFLQGGEDV